MKILLTGATGFLGSHLAKFLFEQGNELLLTRRVTSNTVNCISFENNVNWLYTDNENWISNAIDFKPEIIIHAAWNGVENNKRNDWETQLSNIKFLNDLLYIAKESNLQKFISLGSQAEYGNFTEKVNENSVVNPVTTYGAIKLACMEILKSYCELYKIDWYWLRVFSILGKNDNPAWLIPSVMVKLKNNEKVDLTAGEQSYDYMYIEDFNENIVRVINKNESSSGVYNLCTGNPIKIKDLLISLANKLNKPTDLLNFGAIPYRENQTMNMIGDEKKFISTFGSYSFLNTDAIVDKLI